MQNVPAEPNNKTLEPLNADSKYVPKNKETLNEFGDRIASSNMELRQMGLNKYEIESQGDTPFKRRSYQASCNDAKEIDRQIKDLKEAGVYKVSTSPWASPIVVEAKKNGETCFCVIYKKLDAITKKDSHPLPRINETLDTLHGMH